MFSWRPSSVSQIRKPLLLALGTALLTATPALARNRGHGRGPSAPHAGATTPRTPSSSNPSAAVNAQGCSAQGVVNIATYNVENFWDDVDSNSGTATYNEYQKGGSNWYAEQMYKVKAQKLVDALRMAGTPDVVAMQEIESANNSSRSLEILKPYAESLGYKYFALGQQNSKQPVSVTTAVMSKFPITENRSLDFSVRESQFSGSGRESESVDELNSSARDPQVVTIDIHGKPLRLYTAHWKSRRGDQSIGNTMRMAVAQLIKADVDAQREKNPELDILVMGDFNSDYNESPLQDGMNSSDDKNNIRQDAASDKMYNLWFELPSAERCSYMHDGQLQCLDHMLTSASLFDGKGIDLIENSFHVVGHNGGEAAQKLLRNDGRTPNRWGMQKNSGKSYFTGTGYSDHLPLMASFKLPSLCKPTR
ncbi:MAG: hypothetical protein RLZZ488_937 [Pseudomonadota bacterium]